MVHIKFILLTIGLVLNLATESWAIIDIAEKFLDHSKDMLRHGIQCSQEVGATQDDIEVIMKQKKMPDTRTGQCLFACMMEKFGMLKDGKIVEGRTRELAYSIMGEGDIIADLIGDIGTVCGKKSKDEMDKCVMAKKISECSIGYVQKFRDSLKENLK